MKHRVNMGIMQGRLTESKGRGIQFFPFDNWKKEFYVCKELGLQEIEFIFDYENYENNPLWTKNGLDELIRVMNETGVTVKSICFDYFMRRPFYKYRGSEKVEIKKENRDMLQTVLSAMNKIGAALVEIPLVDNSSLKNEEEKEEFKIFLNEIVKEAPIGISFGLETDLPPNSFLSYIESFQNNLIGANYDSGNSSGIGYDVEEEITTLNSHIFNVHIKDRVYQGTTVALGTGSADLDKLFLNLNKIQYKGSYILQAARGEEGLERKNIQKQKAFVLDKIEKFVG